MNCDHATTRFILTPELKHHGKTVCAACGKFIRWEKKPETIERDKRNAENLVRLRKVETLTKWEREFIESVDGRGSKVTPKQQVCIDAIAAKYV